MLNSFLIADFIVFIIRIFIILNENVELDILVFSRQFFSNIIKYPGISRCDKH